MKIFINYLPFICMAMIIGIVQFLHHRRVSKKAIGNYSKDSEHRENNPELYTREYVIVEIKQTRSMIYGIILIYMALFLFFAFVGIGNARLEEYGQNSLFVIASILIMVIYAMSKLAEEKKAKLILLSLYVLIGGILYVSVFIFRDYDPLSSTKQKEQIASNISHLTITTKSGSKWTPSDEENVYYHVVKYGESLEYIFNDISLSLTKAQEQHFNILKKNKTNNFEIIPQAKYKTELQRKTFFYSGLNPGDTVYLTKKELQKFCIEKGIKG